MVATTIAEVKQQLTSSDIIRLLHALGANLRGRSNGKYLIFDTVCHHQDPNDYKPKLYYYNQSYSFYCFSSCQRIGDVYKLVQQVLNIDRKKAIDYVLDFYNVVLTVPQFDDDFDFFTEKQKEKEEEQLFFHSINLEDIEAIPLPPVKRQGIIRLFSSHPCIEWLREGISKETMQKYDIKFSVEDSSIVIPHHNINGEIVGIRNRNLLPYNIKNFGKYVPMFIYGQMYNHKIGENLYGLDKNKEAIKTFKKVVLFEGEKSVLQMDSVFGDNSISVAVCGSNLSRFQMKMLLDLGVEEFIFGFDKQYKTKEEEQEWSNKIYRLAEPLLKYGVTASKIWDSLENGLLDYKDAPFDKGGDIYNRLVKDREEIQLKIKEKQDDKTQFDFTDY